MAAHGEGENIRSQARTLGPLREAARLGVRTTHRPFFLGDWGLKPQRTPTHFTDPMGEIGIPHPHPTPGRQQLIKPLWIGPPTLPQRTSPEQRAHPPVLARSDPDLAIFPLLLLFAKGAALWKRDKGPGSVAGTIVPAWGPSTRAASAAGLRRGGGT